MYVKENGDSKQCLIKKELELKPEEGNGKQKQMMISVAIIGKQKEFDKCTQVVVILEGKELR